jgi:hypothetical protein
MTKPVQPLKFTNFLLKRPVQCLKMMGSRHVSQFYANSKLELGFSILKRPVQCLKTVSSRHMSQL